MTPASLTPASLTKMAWVQAILELPLRADTMLIGREIRYPVKSLLLLPPNKIQRQKQEGVVFGTDEISIILAHNDSCVE
jgi:hypothetical protein